MNYTGVLARSSGFVVVYLAAVGTLAVIPTILTYGRPEERRKNRARLNALLALIGIILASLLIDPLLAAGDAARDVREGKPVGPIHILGWPVPPIPPFPISRLPVLAVHADPATVEPAGKPGEAPAAERLRGRKLLYLGQAGGTVVLYDPGDQQAVYVSASSIVLRVSNCNTEHSPNPLCGQLQPH